MFMAQDPIFSYSYFSRYYYKSLCCSLLSLLLLSVRTCHGIGTFEFDIHNRYSDPVKGILAVDELPEKGSFQYYSAMAHRDRAVHGRKLAATDGSTPLTFSSGNHTYQINGLGFLHYANVSIGTPSLWFMVALDTGSDLFWVPCDCISCVQGLQTPSGKRIELNTYSPNMSSTSQNILCNNDMCSQQKYCLSAQSNCPYQIAYVSNGTSSTGVLVEDVLHLITDDSRTKAVDAKISLGCGRVQTGSFLDGAAPNGLFGLGMSNISVPSTLAREGYIPNSFSMCFGRDGLGRISFGDKGSSDQGETPFNLHHLHPTYNVSITQTNVDGNATNLEFYSIFDSGTSFTYLNDPAYTLVTEKFNSRVKETSASITDIPFEYCYNLGTNQNDILIPTLSLVMKGGDEFNITDPIVVGSQDGAYFYCLGVLKSRDINIIGQNFMTGYRVVFDRERNVLGWKLSNCSDDDSYSNTLPIAPAGSARPPASAVIPQATAGNDNNSQVTGGLPSPVGNHSPQLNPLTFVLIIAFFAIF
ncbi:hypothetical protein K2173_006234 [Erythroxylum novogranatense]|uniref:Peptidase A1 domain-containing protein n=1 Tax=Erythroxylum novogranatense TaxID=1862640 RepID=A0AAV8TE69_9ROSI|nr:hypothetical protein K2173_006234 [Erythroxylum novogranatense]